VNDSDFAAAAREPRASGYADLLRVCRVVRDGLRAAGGPGSGAFLLDLGRAFEEYVGRVLAEALPRWAIDVQPQLRFDESVSLQPDLILNRGEKCVVLDAKWKRLAGVPEPDDLHQVLAYAAVTGAGHVGLVYPGTRSGRRTIALPNFRLTLFRLRVSGPPADCEASVRRLARAARG
jgi:5-methylcytosine-specific restriction endonuclease McrBC regulatory subunit McrC